MSFAFNCDRCGRFTNPDAPGVSHSRTWYEDGYGGCLRDPGYRCSPCTDKHGIGYTNCAPAYGGNGRNPLNSEPGDHKAAIAARAAQVDGASSRAEHDQ